MREALLFAGSVYLLIVSYLNIKIIIKFKYFLYLNYLCNVFKVSSADFIYLLTEMTTVFY